MSGNARAWGWVRHLFDGGTTQWADWQEPGAPAGRVIPGAQQLEVLRRVNEVAHAGARTVPEALVTRIVHASAAGRGRPDLLLLGAVDPPRFGAAPVDPADLSPTELMRVALHLLTQDLVRGGPAASRQVSVARPWRRRYRLVGDPWLTRSLRRELLVRGHPEHPAGHLVVLGADVPTMLADAWTDNCFIRPVPPWDQWLEEWRRHRRLPPGVDLAAMAAQGVESGPEAAAVHVLTDPGGRRLPRLLGVRTVALPPRPSHVAAELARRLFPVLGLAVHGEERGRLLRDELLPRLPTDHLGAAVPVVPEEHRGWVERRAGRLQQRLESAGYSVAGDLAAYGSGASADGCAHADPADVLTLAVRLLLATSDDGRQESDT